MEDMTADQTSTTSTGGEISEAMMKIYCYFLLRKNTVVN